MSIPFTQYLRPNGQQLPITIDRTEAIEQKAGEIIDRGYVFECEILTTGQISFTIADHSLGMDVAIKISNNGPEVYEAVDDLIGKFHILVLERDLWMGTTWA